MSTLRARSGGPDQLRTGPWRGDPTTAHVAVVGRTPTAADVRRCLEHLTRDGYRAALTAALGPAEQAPFLDAGFVVHERLHLLGHDLAELPPAPRHPLHRARRRHREAVLTTDAAAFDAFWRLDQAALLDALTATPATRFRVWTGPGGGSAVGAYAIVGRAGARGYLQRLAVHPDHQRRGVGSALVVDGLRWARRWGAREVLVNTQEGNEGAVAAYRRLGFGLRSHGLAVLRRELTGP
jgi:ribosomal protein S18 acetylase RimI-like enzyme